MYQIDRRAMSKLKKYGDDILKKARQSVSSLRLKSCRRAQFPMFKCTLYQFITVCGVCEMRVTCGKIQQKSITIRDAFVVDRQDPLNAGHIEDVSYTDVERWSSIEADTEVQSTMMDDCLDDLLSDESTTPVGNSGGIQKPTVHEHGSNNDAEHISRRPLTPLSELRARPNDLEKAWVEGCVTDVQHHIRKLRRLSVPAKMEEERMSTRQLLITELLSRQ